MFNIFKGKKKKERELSKPPIREVTEQEIQDWMKELGVSRSFSTYKPFEDPLLVEEVSDIPSQYKIELIKNLQRKFNENN